ncbi:hypothetical protein BH10BAC5_BH10BAC5_09900 [soil metagenome]
MAMNQEILGEFEHEAKLTRKTLEKIPDDKFDWKPHAKSFSFGKLASHTADIPNWAVMTIKQPELDFATADYKPKDEKTTAEILKNFDDNVKAAVDAIKSASDEDLKTMWKLRNGEQVYFEMPRAQVLRGMVLNHTVHHRAQLGVYLRMLDIPVPAIYGPSADDQGGM